MIKSVLELMEIMAREVAARPVWLKPGFKAWDLLDSRWIEPG
jgi:hypothetical protein